jgi:proline iminopeptidase
MPAHWRCRRAACIDKMNDQHAYLRLPAAATLHAGSARAGDVRVGDLVGCGISHPCTTFDKWSAAAAGRRRLQRPPWRATPSNSALQSSLQPPMSIAMIRYTRLLCSAPIRTDCGHRHAAGRRTCTRSTGKRWATRTASRWCSCMAARARGCRRSTGAFSTREHYRVILFDQRGAGKSTPLGETRHNTTQLLVADMERLREQMRHRAVAGVRRIVGFDPGAGPMARRIPSAASASSCAGSSSAQRAGGRLVPRLASQWFHPELHEEFAGARAGGRARRPAGRPTTARMHGSADPDVYWPAARAWSRFEGRRVFLLPQPEEHRPATRWTWAWAGWRRTTWPTCAFLEEGQLLQRTSARIAHLPAVIVQGRYDVICPPCRRLAPAPGLARARVLKIVPDAGHGALESGHLRARW